MAKGELSRLPGAEKVVIAVLMIASMTQAMGTVAIAVALPQMSLAFPEVSPVLIGMVITLPSFCVAIFSFGVGAVADRIGKVVTLGISAAIFAVMGCVVAFLNNITAILVFRFLLGFGISGMAVATTAIIAERYHGAVRAKVLALQAAFNGFGICLLEGGGGILASFGWRVSFSVYLLGVIILIGTIAAVAPIMRRPVVDPELYGVDVIPEGMDMRSGLAGSALAVALGASFVIFFFQLGNYDLPGRVPYLVEGMGGSSLTSGLLLGANGLMTVLLSLAQGRLVMRISRSTLMAVGIALEGVGFIVLGLSNNIPMALAGTVLSGIGQGLFLPSVAQWANSVATPANSGKVNGLFTMLGNLGVFASSCIIVQVETAAGGISGLYFVSAAMLIVVALVVMFLRRQVNRD